MKNRERVLLLAVLVPTLLLVVLAWLNAREEPAPVAERSREVSPPAVVPVVPPPEKPRVEWKAPHDAGEPREASEGNLMMDDLEVPAEFAKTVAAITPEIELCVHDQQDRVQGGVRFTVQFVPGIDGGFGGYRLKSSTWQDPYLEACLEDVFAEMGAPTAPTSGSPAELTFGFKRHPTH